MAIGILLAAGSGSRMESHNIPKGFIEVDGQPLFMYSLHTFLRQFYECFIVYRIW